jgi:hypothetical protein
LNVTTFASGKYGALRFLLIMRGDRISSARCGMTLLLNEPYISDALASFIAQIVRVIM